ncbi:hypothetical protein BKH41_03815 [Helicobacter sp. 12S02232-10]|uniref:baseplate J/gp47 family protein n=1 Tax=Helicobacter sp. 12S02232-10 TaxID=1476197 RepID=UPI000BA53737|nr:baseplate J/gp47 family protein [Helicobacter sp. 12S02232-10]PAF49217.1 hypothetical protein BKH41_03815 [Helicobacter sp. 12S02232-10]
MNLPKFLIPFNIEDEKNIIIEKFKESYPDYTPLIGDDFSVLTSAFLFRMNRYINYINFTIAQNYLEFSSGEYLDSLVALAGIKRFGGTPFVAKIKISVTSAITLPKGTKFKDNLGHNAYLAKDEEIETESIVEIELEKGLSQDYETTTLEIPNIYISEIVKLTPFTQEAQGESDTELKKRFLLSLSKPSTAGNLKSYQYYSAIPEVAKSKIIHKGLGQIEVIYQAKTPNALLKLQENIEDKIPLTDKLSYIEAKEINLNLTITLTLKNNTKNSEIIHLVDSNVKALFQPLEIGEGISQTKIIASSFMDELIEDVSIEGLESVSSDGILILESLNIVTQVKGGENV